MAALEDASSRPGAPPHRTSPGAIALVRLLRERHALRFIQTLLREWTYVEPYASSRIRRATRRPYLHYYNRQRPHASLGYEAPWSRLTSGA